MNMKDRIEKGLITLQPLSSSSIESGTIGLVYVDSKAHIVTFEHVNSNGDWYVTGEELSLTLVDHTAYTLATLAENKISYPIAINANKLSVLALEGAFTKKHYKQLRSESPESMKSFG